VNGAPAGRRLVAQGRRGGRCPANGSYRGLLGELSALASDGTLSAAELQQKLNTLLAAKWLPKRCPNADFAANRKALIFRRLPTDMAIFREISRTKYRHFWLGAGQFAGNQGLFGQRNTTCRLTRAADRSAATPPYDRATQRSRACRYCVTFCDIVAAHPPQVRQIRVERSIVGDMLDAMRVCGSQGCELLVLWLGEIDVDLGEATVLKAFIPEQKPIKSEDGVGYFISGETLFLINRALSETGLRLIAQVHSHPREAFHSEADDRYAIVTANGGFSLVVPNFGHVAPDPASWAVYQLQDRRWRELSKAAVQSLFTVREGTWA
jgi:hypothetical protein